LIGVGETRRGGKVEVNSQHYKHKGILAWLNLLYWYDKHLQKPGYTKKKKKKPPHRQIFILKPLELPAHFVLQM